MSTREMNGDRVPFGDAESPGHKSYSNDSSKEGTSTTRNFQKLGGWLDDKTRKKLSKDRAFDDRFFTRASVPDKVRKHRGGNRTWNGYSSCLLFFQNFLLISATCSPADSEMCILGIPTPGRTWPQGDIVIEYGQPLQIYCMLNEVLMGQKFGGANASDLSFFRNDVLVDEKYITVINETTIMLYMEQPSPCKDMFYCKLRLNTGLRKRYEAVCLNRVTVGFKPEEPRNFRCVSYNWEKLICSWDPVPNYITTQYSLNFKLPGRLGGRSIFPCPQYNLSPNTCRWDSSTDPMYRQVYESYIFTLNAKNALGINSFTYIFHHWAHVIPAEPVDLSVAAKTSSSALLHWSVPFPMQNFPPGLHHRVSYRSERDPQDIWQTIEITNREHVSENYFYLTDLQYANTVYNVRVSLKSSVAVDEDMWSRFSEITFKTAPALPALPPKTDIGSFEIVRNGDSRDIYIYWQSIPQHLENGDNFTYRVHSVEENGRKLDLQPQEITDIYAMFKGISLNDLKFEIVTVNCQGVNNHPATVHVPSQLELPQKPVVFTKIAFDGGIFELSWNSSCNSNIVDYTIFWCENDRDRPYQCSGYLDWVHVPQNTRIYNTTVPDPKKIYQFAIAANTAKASSGMAWASSTTLSSSVGRIRSIWTTRIESDLIEIGWELEYSGRIGIIESFNIYYCSIVSAQDFTCAGPKIIENVKGDSYMLRGVLRNLKPETAYSITVATLTKNGEGLHSDALYITTLKTMQDPTLKHPTLANTLSNPDATSLDVILPTGIVPRSLIMEEYVEDMNVECGGDGDCRWDKIEKYNPETTDCTSQVSTLTLSMSKCMRELDLLSNENHLLRKSSSACNAILW